MTLSDKKQWENYEENKEDFFLVTNYYFESDVKEFIQNILNDIESFRTPTYNFKFLDKIKDKIKQRAGEELIGDKRK